MNALRQLRRKERQHFPLILAKTVRQVNEALREEFDKEIFRVTPHNQQRLLTLRVWEMKYKVSIQYMLKVIVGYYLPRFKKHHRGDPHSLGIGVPVLVGKNAERILKDQITIDFPQAENISIWRWERMQEIIRKRTDDGTDEEVGTTPLAKLGSVSKYVKRYRSRIEGSRQQFEKEINRPSNTRRPYRGNPFI